jgi:uncharacterized lipoprotein YehR (DUF1307 family)
MNLQQTIKHEFEGAIVAEETIKIDFTPAELEELESWSSSVPENLAFWVLSYIKRKLELRNEGMKEEKDN